jgi:hypothetical protein
MNGRPLIYEYRSPSAASDAVFTPVRADIGAVLATDVFTKAPLAGSSSPRVWLAFAGAGVHILGFWSDDTLEVSLTLEDAATRHERLELTGRFPGWVISGQTPNDQALPDAASSCGAAHAETGASLRTGSRRKATDWSWLVPIAGMGVAQTIVAVGCLIALAAAPPERPQPLVAATPVSRGAQILATAQAHNVGLLVTATPTIAATRTAEQVAHVDLAALLLPQGEAGPHWQSPAGVQSDATDPFHVSMTYVDDAQSDSPRTLLIELSARKVQFDASELSSHLSERGLTPVAVAGLGTGPAVGATTRADNGHARSVYVFTMAQPDQIMVTVTLSGEDVDGTAPGMDGQALDFAKAQEQFMASALRECQLDADTCQIEGATHTTNIS